LLTLLAPISGRYSQVAFHAQNGLWVQYRPGMPNGQSYMLFPGTVIELTMTAEGALLLPPAP
jgi:hypothetical protein